METLGFKRIGVVMNYRFAGYAESQEDAKFIMSVLKVAMVGNYARKLARGEKVEVP